MLFPCESKKRYRNDKAGKVFKEGVGRGRGKFKSDFLQKAGGGRDNAYRNCRFQIGLIKALIIF